MTADGDESETFDTLRVSMRIPAWSFVACFLAAVGLRAVFTGGIWLIVLLGLVAAGSVGHFLSFRLSPRERAIRIHVNREGVREGSRMLIRRSAVRNATIADIPGGGVVLTLRSIARAVTFRMASAEEATRVMARLHVLPSSRAMVFARGTPMWLIPVLSGLAPNVVNGAAHHPYVSLLLGIVACALTFFLSWSRTIATGREGIRISSFLRQRFIGYGEIETIADEAGAIVLRLRGGEVVRVPSRGLWTPYTRESGNRHITHHIRWAQSVLADLSRSQPGVTAAMMATGSARHAANYRVAAVPREHLLATAEDPAADVKLRIAAIDALMSDADADERARLETIGEASASPQLRMAVKRQE